MTLKTRTLALAMGASLAVPALAEAQTGAARPSAPATRGATPPSFLHTPPSQPQTRPAAPVLGATPPKPSSAAKGDSALKKANQPPPPIPLDELAEPAIPLPSEPIEPYLLRKENGPFMVTARVFRGPDATKFAMVLTKELRNTYHLPAYIFYLKIHPGGSNIRNVQPTSPPEVPIGVIGQPEEYRIYDEAAVLVGNCKTIDDAEELMHKVKRLHPECLTKLPGIWQHRKGQGLKWAMVTANPLIPAQHLYPGNGHAAPTFKPGQAVDPAVIIAKFEQSHKKDPLVERMNKGPHSVYKCPGRYTLQVAQYRGRTTTNVNDPNFSKRSFLQKSPLATAADDAENLASNIAKCQALMPGMKPYVYHDRTSSTVTIGSFSGPDDPKLAQLRSTLAKLSLEMIRKQYTHLPLAPAAYPMEVPRP